ncbi:MAG TPA: hypothetical protein VJK72_05725 [Candidatus Nanoarchaeia archaeon]|nr:hypothetical protein [Candidatus Nanoarchaeia archaeon]
MDETPNLFEAVDAGDYNLAARLITESEESDTAKIIDWAWLLETSYKSKLSYRSGYFRALIDTNGLRHVFDDILDGLTKSSSTQIEDYTINLRNESALFDELRLLKVGSDMLLASFVPYLENWKKYNALWGERSDTPQEKK